MKKLLSAILIYALCLNVTISQDCGAYELFNNSGISKAKVNEYLKKIEGFISKIAEHSNPRLHRSPYTIPVVVHIVHKNANENFTDGEIQKAINNLSRQFRKRNSKDINNLPTPFKAVASDANIEFKLARRDPTGKATTGIIRRKVDPAKFPRLDYRQVQKKGTGGIDGWNTDQYLNIWICDLVKPDGSNTLLGIADFPEGYLKNFTTGIVMDFTAMKGNGSTLAHEAGHFLGLRHIWGDDNDKSNTKYGNDLVDDTPPALGINRGCSNYPHKATKNNPDGEMFMNFMDYSSCKSMFTQGQVTRMQANLYAGARRAPLIKSKAWMRPNIAARDHNDILLIPESTSISSWLAAYIMTFGWAVKSNNELNSTISTVSKIMEQNQSFPVISGMSPEISNYANQLGYIVEPVFSNFSAQEFYKMIDRPFIILSSGSSASTSYAIVVKGMGHDESSNTTYLRILDPLGVGPRGFNFKYSNYKTKVKPTSNKGSEYVVDYETFSLDVLNEIVGNNKNIFLLFPPSKSST